MEEGEILKTKVGKGSIYVTLELKTLFLIGTKRLGLLPIYILYYSMQGFSLKIFLYKINLDVNNKITHD